jgi:hypothetical protein
MCVGIEEQMKLQIDGHQTCCPFEYIKPEKLNCCPHMLLVGQQSVGHEIFNLQLLYDFCQLEAAPVGQSVSLALHRYERPWRLHPMSCKVSFGALLYTAEGKAFLRLLGSFNLDNSQLKILDSHNACYDYITVFPNIPQQECFLFRSHCQNIKITEIFLQMTC